MLDSTNRETTDLASELHFLCGRLIFTGDSNDSTDTVVANIFEVDSWSSDFFELIFTVEKNIEKLILLLNDEYYHLNMNNLSKNRHVENLNTIKSAFGRGSLFSKWSSTCLNFITDENVRTLLFLSDSISANHKQLKIPSSDSILVVSGVEIIISRLEVIINNDNRFLIESLIKGLEIFLLRFDRRHYLGTEYLFEGFADVVHKMISLEKFYQEKSTKNEEVMRFFDFSFNKIANIFSIITKIKGISEDSVWTIDIINKIYFYISEGKLLRLGESVIKQIEHMK
jgi:hypothetical protein